MAVERGLRKLVVYQLKGRRMARKAIWPTGKLAETLALVVYIRSRVRRTRPRKGTSTRDLSWRNPSACGVGRERVQCCGEAWDRVLTSVATGFLVTPAQDLVLRDAARHLGASST